MGEEGAQSHWEVAGQAQTHSLFPLVMIGSLAFPLTSDDFELSPAGADHRMGAMGVEFTEL